LLLVHHPKFVDRVPFATHRAFTTLTLYKLLQIPNECRKKRRTASAAGWQQRRSSREPLREADEVALCHSGHVKLEKKRELELLLRASNHPKPYNDKGKLGSPMAQDLGAETDTLGSTTGVDFTRSLGHGHDNNSNWFCVPWLTSLISPISVEGKFAWNKISVGGKLAWN
jgi:hypothetical protein